ncbi:MAG: undecaprenyl-diphosphate phosphatase [Oscillospiraceae bacterium]
MLHDILDAIIQAVIQGLTEFLPVSSSGHLTLYSHLTGKSTDEATFTLVILHLGTLVAVFVAFWDTIKPLFKELGAIFKDIFSGKFTLKDTETRTPQRNMIYMLIVSLVLLIPFYPIKDIFEKAGENLIILGCLFLYTSFILFTSDNIPVKKLTKDAGDITLKDAIIIGLFQAGALFPGVSRSGSTICGGLFRNLKRETAVQYSFILGIPTILAGCLVELKDALELGLDIEFLPIVVGFVVSAVVGICAIKMVSWLINSNKFKVFAVYTLVLGLSVITCGIIEHVTGVGIIEYLT